MLLLGSSYCSLKYYVIIATSEQLSQSYVNHKNRWAVACEARALHDHVDFLVNIILQSYSTQQAHKPSNLPLSLCVFRVES